jgi:hypothetical protein
MDPSAEVNRFILPIHDPQYGGCPDRRGIWVTALSS